MTNSFKERMLKEFEKEFCNNHQKPIRFLRSVFYDEQDGAEQIENFIEIVLSKQIKEIEKEIWEVFPEKYHPKRDNLLAILQKYK